MNTNSAVSFRAAQRRVCPLRTHSRKRQRARDGSLRAIAEVLGAEVTYDAGAITAKKGGETLSFALGGKQLTVTDSAGKTVKTVQLDTAPYKKGGRTYVPVRFFAEAFGLTVQWDQDMQTAVLYDRAALVNDIDSKFTVLNKWIKAQPSTENARTLRTVATIGAAYTAFDTIDGNKDYKIDVKTRFWRTDKPLRRP
ncbi:MAG: stalk domain-containing protein [Butyricicoccus sp.]